MAEDIGQHGVLTTVLGSVALSHGRTVHVADASISGLLQNPQHDATDVHVQQIGEHTPKKYF